MLRRPEEVEAFASEWERAFTAAPHAGPYMCPEWFMAWMEHAHHPGLRLCVARDSSGIAGILPLAYRRGRVGFLCVAANGFEPRHTGIFARGAADRGVFEAMLQHLHAFDRRWVHCYVTRVPAGCPMIEPAESTQFRTVRSQIGNSVVIELPGTWDEYRAQLSPAHRKNVNRRVNGMERAGGRLVRLGLEPTDTEDQVEQLIHDALEVSRRSWQGSLDGRAAISDTDNVELFRAACRRMARKGRLELSVLYAGERPVSFIWGAACWPATTIAKLGFDPEFRDLSPGLAHIALLIRDSIARGGREIDFGHEFPEYKSKWSKRADPLYEAWWYPAGLPTLAYWSRRGARVTKAFAQRVRSAPAAVRQASNGSTGGQHDENP